MLFGVGFRELKDLLNIVLLVRTREERAMRLVEVPEQGFPL